MLQITSWSTNMFSFFVMAVSFQSRFPILICNKSAAEVWICLISEVVTGMFCKKRYSQIFWKFHRKTLALESLFDKAFQNTYFEEYMRTPASVASFFWLSYHSHIYLKRFFPFRLKLKWFNVEEWGSGIFYSNFFLRIINFFIEI